MKGTISKQKPKLSRNLGIKNVKSSKCVGVCVHVCMCVCVCVGMCVSVYVCMCMCVHESEHVLQNLEEISKCRIRGDI